MYFCGMKYIQKFILICLLAACAVPCWSQNDVLQSDKEQREYRDALLTTGSVYSAIQRYFVDTVNLAKVNAITLNAMLQRLDPYTQYMTKEYAKTFQEATSGSYAGIGAIISQRPNGAVIINEPFHGLPADKAGLIAGDRILKIDGKDFSHSTTPEVSKALRGPENSTITIVVLRYGETKPRTFVFKREDISINSVPYYGRLGNDIGFIRLSSFTSESANDVKNAIDSMLKQGKLKGFILDLRSNGGGVLQSAVKILSYFVPKGTEVVSVKGRSADANAVYKTTSEPILPNVPMVVLINDESASASEIVSGALQDLDRAVIMGERSYGKGLVQSTIPMADGGLLKLTTAQYFIPSGRNIQRIAYHHFNEPDSVANKQQNELQNSEETVLKPDSLGAPFYTKNGRVVYGSNGIFPDVQLKSQLYPVIVTFMSVDTLVFDYISDFVRKNPHITDKLPFHLTDAQYNDFKNYILSKGFKYEPPSVLMLDKVQELLKDEQREAYTKEALEAFRNSIKPNIKLELESHKKDIKEFLEGQIALRKKYRQGYFEQTFDSDNQIEAAIKLLQDPSAYKKLLMPTSKVAKSTNRK